MEQIRRTTPAPLGQDAESLPFGDLLRRFRMARGWTQEELAERAGISPRSIINCESGATQRPQRETVRLLSDALELVPADRALLAAAVAAQRAQVLTPAPAARPTPSVHLPVPLTPLLGRESELAALTGLLTQGDLRLLSIVGPGGVGKTRLALAVAGAVHWVFPDGVFFVSLALVREPEMLWHVVAQVLGIEPTRSQTAYDAVRTWLRDRTVLLVLDNFEHLLSEAVMVVNLLNACPRTAILTTSRAPLRVRGEQEYPLAPLKIPVDGAAAGTVASSPAVLVFSHYARAVRPEFQVTAENAAAVAAVCAHLDGLPLALELAAPHARSLSVGQLLRRLTPRLPALVDGPRDLASRQRTMRDTLAWSDSLLADAERDVFARLAVFAGGGKPEAVEAVCGVGAIAHADALVHQNLLAVTPDEDGAPRYDMLEIVREYAWERAVYTDVAEETQQRHARYFLALAEEARSQLSGSERGRWIRQLTAEIDNLRAALRWARDSGDAATSLRLLRALHPFWRDRGYLREAAEWARVALELEDPSNPDVQAFRAAALVSAGDLRYRLGEYEGAVQCANEGLALARARGEAQTVADALTLLGILAIDRGEPGRARDYLEESLVLLRRLDRPSAVARVLHSLANEAFMRGEYPRAIELAEESYAITEVLGEEANAAAELSMIARTYNAMGDHARALNYARTSLDRYVRAGNRPFYASGLFIQGDILRALHRHAEAIALYDQGIAITVDIGAPRDEFWGVMGRADAMAAQGDYPEAASSFARGLAVADRIASRQPYAPGLEGIAILAHALGRHHEATMLLGAASALQRTIGMPQRAEGRAAAEAARDALGEEEFEGAWESGEAMTLEAAITQAKAFLATVGRDHDRATTRANS
jgi:predicted ATPase/transcriptional regulator with XRE-family HTH domain